MKRTLPAPARSRPPSAATAIPDAVTSTSAARRPSPLERIGHAELLLTEVLPRGGQLHPTAREDRNLTVRADAVDPGVVGEQEPAARLREDFGRRDQLD